MAQQCYAKVVWAFIDNTDKHMTFGYGVSPEAALALMPPQIRLQHNWRLAIQMPILQARKFYQDAVKTYG
jgi:hypothetical protein